MSRRPNQLLNAALSLITGVAFIVKKKKNMTQMEMLVNKLSVLKFYSCSRTHSEDTATCDQMNCAFILNKVVHFSGFEHDGNIAIMLVLDSAKDIKF